MAWVLEHSESTGTARNVLHSIANHVGPDGEGWCYVETVLHEARCSRDSYHRAVKWAIEAGELTREVRAGGSAKVPDVRRPNHFAFPKMRPPQPAGDADPDPREMQDPDPGSLPTSSDPQPAGDGSRAVQEPSLEPSSRAPAEPTPFDRFWQVFALDAPKGSRRKTAKPAALKAFTAAVRRGNDPEMIIDGAARWAAWYARRVESDPSAVNFEPMGSTFLNQDRFNDETGGVVGRGAAQSNLEAVREAQDAYEVGGMAPGDLFGFGDSHG